MLTRMRKVFILLCMILLFSGGVVSNAFCLDPVGLWHFDENTDQIAYDSSYFGNDGTIHGADWTEGKLKSALSFNGWSDYVDCGNDSSLNLDGSSFSISIWAKFDDFSKKRTLVSKGTFFATDQNMHIVLLNSGELRFGFYADDLTIAKNFYTGRLYYIVCTFDAVTKGRKIYIDGIEQGSNQAVNSLTNTNGAKLEIGRAYSRFNEAMDGLIDEVKIYKAVLSKDEILKEYQDFTASLISHWSFNENAQNYAYDYGDKNNTAYIHGASWTNYSKYGKALYFDGANDYVDCGNNTSLNIDDSSFSISMWAKFDTFSKKRTLISKGTYFATDQNMHIVMLNSGELRFGFYADDLTIAKNFYTGILYHIVCTFDAETKVRKIYIDSVEEGTDQSINTLSNTDGSKLEIGRAYSRFNEAMNGVIDEVKIYNRALTEDEVLEEYNLQPISAVGSSIQEWNGALYGYNYVADGKISTRWSSLWNSDPQWIYIDFGTPRTFNTVKLKWEAAYGKKYKIQISNYGNPYWQTIYEETDGNGGTDEILVGPKTARYVRMYGEERGAGWGYSLWEFIVYK